MLGRKISALSFCLADKFLSLLLPVGTYSGIHLLFAHLFIGQIFTEVLWAGLPEAWDHDNNVDDKMGSLIAQCAPRILINELRSLAHTLVFNV